MIFRYLSDAQGGIIKLSYLTFAHIVTSVCGDQVNKARNTDHAARTCERFVYSIVKIRILYDYHTWEKQFF